MSIQIKNKHLFLVILVVLAGIFFLGGYTGHKKADNASNALILALNDSISTYKYKVEGLTKTAFEQAQIITTQKEAIKRGDLERKELRALNIRQLSEINRLSVQVDTLLANVGHNGTIIALQQGVIDSLSKIPNASNISHNAILLPFEFTKKDKWLDLKGNFDKDGKLDIGEKLEADVDIFTGLDKDTKQYKSVLVTDCPYISVLNIRSQKFDLKKPTRWGIGLNAGYGIILDKDVHLAPYLGIGGSYNLIRF